MELADLLELMYRGRESFRTVRATIRNWRDDETYQAAFERFHEQLDRRSGSTSVLSVSLGDPDAGPERESTEELVRLWVARPARLRIEVEGRWARTLVTDGKTSWHYDVHLGAIAHEREEEDDGEEEPLLLDPASVVPGLELEPLGRMTWGGREAIRVRARPREADEELFWHDLHGLAPGAEAYDLIVDVERGVLLRAAAYLDGEEFATTEVLEIAFDEPIDPATFTFVPPPGETVRREEELDADLRDVTIEEAAVLAPFPVWIPARLPLGWEMEVTYQEASERPIWPASVSIHYRRMTEDEPSQFTLDERAAGKERAPGPAWEWIEREGQALFVWAPPERKRGMPTLVRLERGGTTIREWHDEERGRRTFERVEPGEDDDIACAEPDRCASERATREGIVRIASGPRACARSGRETCAAPSSRSGMASAGGRMTRSAASIRTKATRTLGATSVRASSTCSIPRR